MSEKDALCFGFFVFFLNSFLLFSSSIDLFSLLRAWEACGSKSQRQSNALVRIEARETHPFANNREVREQLFEEVKELSVTGRIARRHRER